MTACSRHRRRPALLAWLLALVVMAMLLRPVLDIATEMHLADHAVATVATDANCAADADLERAHGLTHQENSGSVCADISLELVIPLVTFAPDFGTAPTMLRLPTRYLATPFKPPIA